MVKNCVPILFIFLGWGGGVGVRDLGLVNEALLSKLLWIFMNEKIKLWRRVVAIEYGKDDSGCYASKLNLSYGQSLWRCIRSG